MNAAGPLDDCDDAVKTVSQAVMFGRRLDKLAKHLRRYPTKQGVTCYRLYERDIQEIPLVVDRYEDHLHLAEYATAYQRTDAQQTRWLDAMMKVASETLATPLPKIFLKRRERQRGSQQHLHVADERYELVVNEGGLQFIVNLTDYVDTGLFLDHRITRSMVRDQAAGKQVLNLFAYTGSFSVYAAAGGASSVTTVDWSSTYLDWARRNFELNKLSTMAHPFVRQSATEFVAQHPQQPTYDLAIIDPPTFSNSKRTTDVWDVQRDSIRLLQAVMPLMRPGGVIYFSSNFRDFRFDSNLLPGATVHEISNQTVPPNYRNKKIHRCWRIVSNALGLP